MRLRPWLLGGVLAALAIPSARCLGQSLEEASAEFARRWGAGEVSSLERSLSRSGVRLQWEARRVGSLDRRHAGASIREYLASRQGLATSVTRVEEVEGDPPRGYAEIRWESRIEGTSDILARTVFVAFRAEGDGWHVTEVRVLPVTRSRKLRPSLT